MKVKYVPCQPHCFAFGGFEVQMLSTFEAVKACGVKAEKMNPWDRDVDFEIMHIWGLEHIHDLTIFFGKKVNKKIVITSLFPDFNTVNRKLRHFASSYIGNARYMKKLASLADAIVVVNSVESHIANRYFDIPKEKLHYIPNIVSEKYLNSQNSPGIFYGMHNYVLCTGNICKRKNQLNLVKACIKANLNLIIIGKIIPGEEAYGAEIKKLANVHHNILWIDGLKENSNELIEAYQNCTVFALPSYHEQGPISAYEAVSMGCKVLLANKPYASQIFFNHTTKVNPDSVNDIAHTLMVMLIDSGPITVDTKAIMSSCLANNVGIQYKKLYESLYL